MSETDQPDGSRYPRAYAGEPSTVARAPLTADQLDYMADLILELKQMAERLDLDTLTVILALGHREALHQVSKRRA